MKFFVCTLALSCAVVFSLTAQRDTTRVLDEVVVAAYRSNRPLQEVAASVVVVDSLALMRFAPVSLLPAVNTLAGVRMEERSPGSYRFAIRGSSLRSPFGVRNVKFYWNGLPLTDGGGNTYLNLLDFNSIQSMEIIKGPGASLYGAGTGGVVLLNSALQNRHPHFTYSATGGSYGLFQVQAGGSVLQTEKTTLIARTSYQQADGYRDQSEMNRFVTGIEWSTALSPASLLSGMLFNSSLFYETPGGLTQAQFEDDPSQARPPSPTMPGAEDQKAAIENRTSYLGIQYEQTWNNSWSTRLGAYGSLTRFENPAIRNFEKRKERNGGFRTDTQYRLVRTRWNSIFTAGAEIQFFGSTVDVFGNNLGEATTRTSSDKLHSQLTLLFAQADIALPHDYFITLGGSVNFVNYRDQPLSAERMSIRFNPEFSPRIAVLKKFSPSFSLYANISRGFSPPTFAEALPSTGIFNPDLNAERGVSYEVGMRGKLFKQLSFDISMYDFRLRNALVIQRDEDGADYFVNAGSTSQRGVESTLGWSPVLNPQQWINAMKIWASVTLTDYTFEEYVQNDTDFSGNQLTGTPASVIAGGMDLHMGKSFSLNITASFTDRIPLDDANLNFSADYFLLGVKAGYQLRGKIPMEFFAGADNLLNEKYSLGNDLNAAGARFYNAAAPRNFFAGIRVSIAPKMD